MTFERYELQLCLLSNLSNPTVNPSANLSIGEMDNTASKKSKEESKDEECCRTLMRLHPWKPALVYEYALCLELSHETWVFFPQGRLFCLCNELSSFSMD